MSLNPPSLKMFRNIIASLRGEAGFRKKRRFKEDKNLNKASMALHL